MAGSADTVRAGIALGSNLGDRLAHLRQARGPQSCDLPAVSRRRCIASRIYETEPVARTAGAGAFLNAVIEVEFAGQPSDAARRAAGDRSAAGRPSKRPRNAPRTIDLDVLYVGNLVLSNEEIVIPHPRLHLRRFVLAAARRYPARSWCCRAGGKRRRAARDNLQDPAGVQLFAGALGAMNAALEPQLRAMKQRGEKIAMLTAYDYPTARLLDESGVDVLLVGDSLGMVVLGYPDTTLVTMDEMLHHTRAVARGATAGADPAPTCRSAPTTRRQPAVENARRLIEAGAHAVKLEGGATHAAQIAALVAAGIPAMAHIGMMPQSVRIEGGYRIKGKTPEEADALARRCAGRRSRRRIWPAARTGAAGCRAPAYRQRDRFPTIGIGVRQRLRRPGARHARSHRRLSRGSRRSL